jgi:hypothetical protein
MSARTRRSLLRAASPTRLRPALAGSEPAVDSAPALSRRLFLQSSAGAAAGVVVVTTGPRLATAALGTGTATAPTRVITKPSGPPPRETVMAYVRNAARGEVTVMSGTREMTYTDPVLVKQLLDASR